MKRILALAFAATLITALVPTDVDARGGRGGGGGAAWVAVVAAWAVEALAAVALAEWVAAATGPVEWVVATGVAWAAASGRRWRELARRASWLAPRLWLGRGGDRRGRGRRISLGSHLSYGSYAADNSCMQQRTVRRGGAYRTVWVNVLAARTRRQRHEPAAFVAGVIHHLVALPVRDRFSQSAVGR